MSSSRRGRGGGSAGVEGLRGGGRAGAEDRRAHAEEVWRVAFVRGDGAKRMAARKYTNWNARVPPKLAPFAIGGEFYKDSPPLPPHDAGVLLQFRLGGGRGGARPRTAR